MNNDGGPAFPIITPDMPVTGSPGISMRDYFAAAALQGFAFLKVYTQTNPNANTYEELARCSYELADAMIVERAKKP